MDYRQLVGRASGGILVPVWEIVNPKVAVSCGSRECDDSQTLDAHRASRNTDRPIKVYTVGQHAVPSVRWCHNGACSSTGSGANVGQRADLVQAILMFHPVLPPSGTQISKKRSVTGRRIHVAIRICPKYRRERKIPTRSWSPDGVPYDVTPAKPLGPYWMDSGLVEVMMADGQKPSLVDLA